MTAVTQPETAPDDAPRVTDLCGVDLSLATTFVDGPPHVAFDALRAAAPVAWQDEKVSDNRIAGVATGLPAPASAGFWCVTSHALVSEVSKDPSLWSSQLGGTQLFTANEMVLVGLRMMLLNMDPPDHIRLRKVLTPSFSPRAVDLMRQAVESNATELADRLADRLAGGGTVDLVANVTRELPTRTLASMLGMPAEDRHLIPQWSDTLLGGQAELSLDDMMAAAATAQEVYDYGAAMFHERRANPRNDVVSILATAEVDGEQLTAEEFTRFWMLLIIAGNETTRNSMSGAVLALQQEGLWEQLARDVTANPEVLGLLANEELVRFVSPVIHFRRTATRDTELGGQQIRAGDKVVMWYSAANRDPAVFADPHHLDLARDPNPHLAFGIGQHFCLGTRLARLQMLTMLRTLLVRYPKLCLDGEPTHVTSNFINGIAALPVSV